MKIEHYSFGKMVVAGNTYHADLCLVAGRVLPEWWRQEGHLLQLVDLERILGAEPRILVVGRGAYGMMRIAAEVGAECARRGIELVAERTAPAVSRFNELSAQAEGEVAGAFHLTC